MRVKFLAQRNNGSFNVFVLTKHNKKYGRIVQTYFFEETFGDR